VVERVGIYFTSSCFSTTYCLLLENYYLPGDLEARIEAFVADYNHRRYHESIHNLTPADVYCGRGQIILLQRERIKRRTIALRLCVPRTPSVLIT